MTTQQAWLFDDGAITDAFDAAKDAGPADIENIRQGGRAIPVGRGVHRAECPTSFAAGSND